jgi:hypothetical protein
MNLNDCSFKEGKLHRILSRSLVWHEIVQIIMSPKRKFDKYRPDRASEPNNLDMFLVFYRQM